MSDEFTRNKKSKLWSSEEDAVTSLAAILETNFQMEVDTSIENACRVAGLNEVAFGFRIKPPTSRDQLHCLQNIASSFHMKDEEVRMSDRHGDKTENQVMARGDIDMSLAIPIEKCLFQPMFNAMVQVFLETPLHGMATHHAFDGGKAPKCS
jgi:hypothetical protein